MIPKIIWTYWDKPEIPVYIQDCLNTWKYHCKNNWSINILNRETIKLFLEENIDYPINIWNDGPQHQSDMFGVALVNKYGGVWMDANIIMQKPINYVLEKEWFGYNDNGTEVFLFGSYKNSYIINRIHKLFFKIFSFNKDIRIQVLKQTYSIDDNYLYPQKLINYLMTSDEKIGHIITNTVNQWETIYILVVVLHRQFNINQKKEVFKFLIEKEGNIPELILNQPLLKLQGAAQQDEYKLNRNSWWYKLTNN